MMFDVYQPCGYKEDVEERAVHYDCYNEVEVDLREDEFAVADGDL